MRRPAAGRASPSKPPTLEQGAALHQAGELDRAERLYRALLAGPPEPARMAMQLLALLLRQSGRPTEAVEVYDSLISTGPASADIHLQRAVLLQGLMRLTEAVAAYDAALSIGPPDAATLNNRGAALEALGRPAQALASYDAALQIRPLYAEALYNRGVALDVLGRTAEALESYERSLAVDSAAARTHNNRGVALAALARLPEAVLAYDQALALAPSYAEALNNRSAALRKLNQPEAALDSVERALAIRPDYAEALNTRGLALAALGRLDAALESYNRAFALDPRQIEALNSAGQALEALGRTDAALKRFDQALAIDPAFAEAEFNSALALLRAGRFDEGRPRYEARWRRRGQPGPAFPDETLWLGETPVAGQTLLLHAEQGLGDTLQFCRYAPIAAALGARVLLQVQPALKRLMASLEGVASVTTVEEPFTPFDQHTPLMSLPLVMGAPALLASPAYLRAEPAKVEAWRASLPEPERSRIGLVWSGNPEHENDRNRSLPLEALAPILACDRQFVSLQNMVRPADDERLGRTSQVLRVERGLQDFSDTAALAATCDLVISVDTSVAHLAGALGRPVWILLPHFADWRWGAAGDATPWYPTARLFRQRTAGDWGEVLARVVEALGTL